MRMASRILLILAAVILAVPARALDPSAAPKTTLPKDSLPKTEVPVPMPTLPKNIGVIAGKIEIFDSPRGGCMKAVNPVLLDDGNPVAEGVLFLYRIATGNPLSTGYGYEIKGRKPGVHKIAVRVDGECTGFRWSPRSREIRLEPPDMKVVDQNFVYRRTAK